jgi:hypothetical protein
MNEANLPAYLHNYIFRLEKLGYIQYPNIFLQGIKYLPRVKYFLRSRACFFFVVNSHQHSELSDEADVPNEGLRSVRRARLKSRRVFLILLNRVYAVRLPSKARTFTAKCFRVPLTD